MTKGIFVAAALCSGLLAAGCSSTPFQPQAVAESQFVDRAITRIDGGVTVRAAVPTAQETSGLLGLDLYERGIQPVWLEVTNSTEAGVRVALFSVDSQYYSPLEVAWYHRKDIRKDDRPSLERWFYENQMPRTVPAGESRSGFVFTHHTAGTKGFNVDVYARNHAYNFTFFVPLPGFTADHMTVDFKALYSDDEIQNLDRDELFEYLTNLTWYSTDASGDLAGEPMNVAFVGTMRGLRRSLLRGGWQETPAGGIETVQARKHHFRGRIPDVTVHKSRPDGTERKELRLWLTPARYGEQTVWLGQVSYDMSGGKGDAAYASYRIDPDVDDAKRFLLQNIWYNQSLREATFLRSGPESLIDNPSVSFDGSEYFTNGVRLVLFVSESPVAFDDTVVTTGAEEQAE